MYIQTEILSNYVVVCHAIFIDFTSKNIDLLVYEILNILCSAAAYWVFHLPQFPSSSFSYLLFPAAAWNKVAEQSWAVSSLSWI